ncbi:helix-turn-helix domain-containing protein [Microvirga sp. P5_D2]
MAVPFPNPTTLEQMRANSRHLNATFFTRRPRMKDRMPEPPEVPSPEPEEGQPSIHSEPVARVLDAVATTANISIQAMMAEDSGTAAVARQIAVAVLVRSNLASPTDAATICGLSFGAAHRALVRFDPFIDGAALPILNSPIACVLPLWRNAMDDLRSYSRSSTFGDCLRAASRVSGVSVHDMKTERRTKHLAKARHIAMWLGTQFTCLSLPSLGKGLGGRDHTTILHGSRVAASIASTISAREDWGLQEWADALWVADWDAIKKGRCS